MASSGTTDGSIGKAERGRWRNVRFASGKAASSAAAKSACTGSEANVEVVGQGAALSEKPGTEVLRRGEQRQTGGNQLRLAHDAGATTGRVDQSFLHAYGDA